MALRRMPVPLSGRKVGEREEKLPVESPLWGRHVLCPSPIVRLGAGHESVSVRRCHLAFGGGAPSPPLGVCDVRRYALTFVLVCMLVPKKKKMVSECVLIMSE